MFSIKSKGRRILLNCGILSLALGLTGAVFADGDGERSGGEHSESAPTTRATGHEEGPGEGEEAGPRLAANETHDEIRNGVRLILAYDAEADAFVGTMENTTYAVVSDARVEVHLVGSVELGPTPRLDLFPRQTVSVNLPAEGNSFTWWKAHSETGSEEGHGSEAGEHSGEGGGEHGREGGESGGEHSGEGRGEHGREG